MSLINTILATLVTLGVLVTIHEWGHFWVARRCGIRVLRFSIGFGKPLWVRQGKDGTEYAIASIPLGGYVKMLDEREGEVPPELRSQAFNNKSVWQRIAVVAAGPLVNLLFAVLAYWFLFSLGITVVKPVIGTVEPGTIAARAGLESQMEIVEVDGRAVNSWDEINLALAARIGESGNLVIRAGDPEAGWLKTYTAPLNGWSIELESQSPIQALGLIPWRPQVKPLVGQVIEGGAAETAGLKAGDLVKSVDGQTVEQWMQLVSIVQQAPDRQLEFQIERRGADILVPVTPNSRTLDSGEVQGYIGVGVESPEWPANSLRTLSLNPIEAFSSGVDKTAQMIGLTLDSIGKMIVGAISVKNLSGPITIAKVAGASAASGLESFVGFLAYLSVSLGVLNLLPIPMLDGGHLVYYIVELVRGKPVSERIQVLGMKIGMAILLTLMSLAMINDIARL